MTRAHHMFLESRDVTYPTVEKASFSTRRKMAQFALALSIFSVSSACAVDIEKNSIKDYSDIITTTKGGAPNLPTLPTVGEDSAETQTSHEVNAPTYEAALPSEISKVTYIYVNARDYVVADVPKGEPGYYGEPNYDSSELALENIRSATNGIFNPTIYNGGNITVDVDPKYIDFHPANEEEEKALADYNSSLANQVRQELYGTDELPDGEILIIEWGFPFNYNGTAAALGGYSTRTVQLFEQGRYYPPSIMHELGHVFGLGHSGLMLNEQLPDGGGVIEVYEAPELFEYSDPSNIMGKGLGDSDIFNGLQMARLELLPSSRIDSYELRNLPEEVTIDSLLSEGETNNPKLIQIEIPHAEDSDLSYYYIELSGGTSETDDSEPEAQRISLNQSVKVYIADDFRSTAMPYYSTTMVNLSGASIRISGTGYEDFGADASMIGQDIFLDLNTGFKITLDSLEASPDRPNQAIAKLSFEIVELNINNS